MFGKLPVDLDRNQPTETLSSSVIIMIDKYSGSRKMRKTCFHIFSPVIPTGYQLMWRSCLTNIYTLHSTYTYYISLLVHKISPSFSVANKLDLNLLGYYSWRKERFLLSSSEGKSLMKKKVGTFWNVVCGCSLDLMP